MVAVGIARRGGRVTLGAGGMVGIGGKVAFVRAEAAGRVGRVPSFGRVVAAGGRTAAPGSGGMALGCGRLPGARSGGQVVACGSFGTAAIGGSVAPGYVGSACIGGCSFLAWVGSEEVLFVEDVALQRSSGSTRSAGRESLIRRSSALSCRARGRQLSNKCAIAVGYCISK